MISPSALLLRTVPSTEPLPLASRIIRCSQARMSMTPVALSRKLVICCIAVAGLGLIIDPTSLSYTQPPESLGVISTMPYQPSIPSSSQCTTYTSSQLYSELAGVAGSESTATTAAASSGTGSSTGTTRATQSSSTVSRAAGAANNAPTSRGPTGAASVGAPIAFSTAALAVVFAGALML